MTTSTTISRRPATHGDDHGGGILRDLLPTIELTPRVVEALAAENWRLDTDDPPAVAAALATARVLVVADRGRDARQRAEIRAAWADWDADQDQDQASPAAGKAVTA
jgi:hypothetical protein